MDGAHFSNESKASSENKCSETIISKDWQRIKLKFIYIMHNKSTKKKQ